MDKLGIKKLIVESLNLEGVDPASIDDEAPLFGGAAVSSPGEARKPGLGLDSVDALELVVALEKACGIKIQSSEVGRDTFASVSSLARFVAAKSEAGSAGRAAVGGSGD